MTKTIRTSSNRKWQRATISLDRTNRWNAVLLTHCVALTTRTETNRSTTLLIVRCGDGRPASPNKNVLSADDDWKYVSNLHNWQTLTNCNQCKRTTRWAYPMNNTELQRKQKRKQFEIKTLLNGLHSMAVRCNSFFGGSRFLIQSKHFRMEVTSSLKIECMQFHFDIFGWCSSLCKCSRLLRAPNPIFGAVQCLSDEVRVALTSSKSN